MKIRFVLYFIFIKKIISSINNNNQKIDDQLEVVEKKFEFFNNISFRQKNDIIE